MISSLLRENTLRFANASVANTTLLRGLSRPRDKLPPVESCFGSRARQRSGGPIVQWIDHVLGRGKEGLCQFRVQWFELRANLVLECL